ncbi:MAG: hypothetical protein U1E70_15115 [Acetobacteraceae bacterium]
MAAPLDPLQLCDRTRDAYLAQRDLPAADGLFAPQVFASLRALIVPRAAQGTAPGRASRASAPPGGHGPNQTVTATLVVLSGVLIGSIAIGTLTFSILLTGALGLAGYFAAGGTVLGFAPWRPARQQAAPIIAEARPAERLPDLDRLEIALRQADALLAHVRDVRQAEPPPATEAPLDEGFLVFLQDLAEAGLEGDGDHLIKLTRRRLSAVMATLGLRLADLDAATQSFFAIDQVPDAVRRGQDVTIRPAIMRDGHCLARGYARRYV